MCRVIVFAGTTEGRKLSAFLEERQIPAMICVATEYGESVLEEYAQLEVRSLEHLPRFLTMKSGFTREFCRLRRLSVYVPSLESVENM